MDDMTVRDEADVPLVTVYITNHNYGKYLSQAVDSVIGQSVQDYEIIIIDDGSTDNSREVAEAYAHLSSVRIVYQQRKGLNVTNNIALRLARGRYIMRLDADDYLEPNALLVMTRILENDENLGLVFPDYFLVDTHGHVLNLERRHAFSKDVSMLDMPAHGACTMIRRQFLLDVGGYDESFTCQDGYDLWIKFIDRYKVTNVNLPLFYYRQHGANLTRNENRLLETRAAIKRAFVDANRTAVTATAMIPVRGARHDANGLALRELGGRNILDRLIDAATHATSVRHVVVTSSDPRIETYVRTHYPPESSVFFMKRTEALERQNVPLGKTAHAVLEHPLICENGSEALISLSPSCPFVSSKVIDEAVHNLILFGADSVVGVRPVSDLLYRHTGKGMEPILDQERFTKIEREALWRNTGGLYVAQNHLVRDSNTLSGSLMSHVVLSQREAFTIQTEFDFTIAEKICELD